MAQITQDFNSKISFTYSHFSFFIFEKNFIQNSTSAAEFTIRVPIYFFFPDLRISSFFFINLKKKTGTGRGPFLVPLTAFSVLYDIFGILYRK